MKAKKRVRYNPCLRWILIVLVSLTAGIEFYTLNAKNLLGNEMPMPFGYGVSVVLTGSMEPTVSVNDVVVVKKSDEYEIGDIVIYQAGRELIIHRIVELDDDTAVMQGDANNAADDPVSQKAILGKMVAKWHGGGKLLKAVRSPAGILTIFIASAVMLVLSYRREDRMSGETLDEIKTEIEKLRKEIGEGNESHGDEKQEK